MFRQRRFSALTALERLRNLSSDESGGSEDSESEEEETPENAPTIASGLHSSESSESEMEGNDIEPSSVQHEVRGTMNRSGQASAILKGKDGTSWRWGSASQSVRGRAANRNVFRARPGPTSYATSRIQSDSHASAFRILFDEPILRNIQKCTTVEARRVTGCESWSVSLEELDKFFGLMIARGVIGARSLPLNSLWGSEWGCPLFNKTMPRNRFLEILRFLRFDIKSERKQRLAEDKFALASNIWYPFVENCQKAFVPDCYVTVDEQLLPCKARCKFIQYISTKPDKFGIKFWLAADVANKYVFNGFPYTGRDQAREPDCSVATDTVMKLLAPLFNKGYHVTCDNFFTSVSLTRKLLAKKCTLVGTMRKNRREVPPEILMKQGLHESSFLKTDDGITLTNYQCKTSKSVLLLSSLHQDVQIPVNENPKKKPETVIFYNQNKVAIDVVDQMIRNYSTRSGSRRWPLHVLFNVLDIALSNSWIIYKNVCHSSISRRSFIQRVSQELTGHTPREASVACAVAVNTDDDGNTCTRKTCATKLCNKNRTTDRCNLCRKPVCGKCSVKLCPSCSI